MHRNNGNPSKKIRSMDLNVYKASQSRTSLVERVAAAATAANSISKKTPKYVELVRKNDEIAYGEREQILGKIGTSSFDAHMVTNRINKQYSYSVISFYSDIYFIRMQIIDDNIACFQERAVSQTLRALELEVSYVTRAFTFSVSSHEFSFS
jgi:hypothetical protein